MKRTTLVFLGFTIILGLGTAVFAAHGGSSTTTRPSTRGISAGPFSDVPPFLPERAPILFFADLKVIDGYSDGTFKPHRTLNRAEASKIILLVVANDREKARRRPKQSCYTDVKSVAWFSRYVCGNRFIQGYADGSFRPGNEVTVGEALKMMYVAFSGTYERNRGQDPWYKKLLENAKKAQFVRQNTDGGESVTRGEFLDMLYRFYASYKDTSLRPVSFLSLDQSTIQPSPSSRTGQMDQRRESGQTSSALRTADQTRNLPPTPSSGISVTQSTEAGSPALVYSKRFLDAFNLGLQFMENHLSTPGGAIFSNLDSHYEPSSVVGVNHEVLSESYGLVFTALARAGRQQSFEKYYQFFVTRVLDPRTKLAYWKLKEDLSVYQNANAVIDDLRIIRGLLLGYEKFGISQYRTTALEMANSLKQHGVRNNVIVSHIGWNPNDNRYFPASELRLGYADIATMKKLSAYDSAWQTIANTTQQVLINAQYPTGLFKPVYRHGDQTYQEDDEVETIFQAYIGEYLAEAGERNASQKLLDFFKNEWASRRKIINSYDPNGAPNGTHENLAVYGIIARMAHYLGDRLFAEQMGDKLISLLIQRGGSRFRGAFAWSEGDRIYSFNQGNALQTLALLATTPSIPPPPPPHEAVAANQFILWHMADVYYGPHHDDDCGQMVDDMDTVPWNEAVVAGDLAGDGSIRNYDGFLACIAKSSNPRSKFHIVAGNHEYQCSGRPEEGCLANYQAKIGQELFFTWDYGNIHFIMFSVDDGKSNVKDATVQWIRNEIAQNQGKIVIPVNHHMPHHFRWSNDLLNSYGIDIWLFGHAHCKHGDSGCTRHGAKGDFYQEAETTFVDAGYIGNMESRYLIFTEGSNEVIIRSRHHGNARFQPEFERRVRIRHPFRR